MNGLNRIKKDFGSRFSDVFKSITSDNGSEFVQLPTLEIQNTKVYFTHPYSLFERGTNEHHNAILRRFLPKARRISNYIHEAIYHLEDWINTLPCKLLSYKMPQKLFDLELDLIYTR